MTNWYVGYKWQMGELAIHYKKDLTEIQARDLCATLVSEGAALIELFEVRKVSRWVTAAPFPDRIDDDGLDSGNATTTQGDTNGNTSA